MNDSAPGAAPEPVTETWTYGGTRATGKDGKKWHAWLDPAGEEHWFARAGGGRMAAGSRCTAQVTRRDGGAITPHGPPEYARSQAGQVARQALWTQHTLAQSGSRPRAERDAARATSWTRPSPRSWSWPPRCARARGATPSPPTSSARLPGTDVPEWTVTCAFTRSTCPRRSLVPLIQRNLFAGPVRASSAVDTRRQPFEPGRDGIFCSRGSFVSRVPVRVSDSTQAAAAAVTDSEHTASATVRCSRA